MKGMIAIALLGTIGVISALENGLARTPPMGWLAWERFRCIIDCEILPEECISEKLFKKVADLMVSEGYAAAGYEYVIIDDCWLENSRNNTGHLEGDKKRFPSGIRELSKYIHSKGLKFGIYEDYGTKTCEGYPGVLGHLQRDAETFADWEVDYVKLDGCNADPRIMDLGYPEFGSFLNKTGRPMVYSCSWPYYQQARGMTINYESIAKYCNLWRNYDDIQDSWQSLSSIMDSIADKQDLWQPHAGPGHWNDPDMLLIGNYGLSYEQSKTQMAVWAILAAPLLMSNDLANIRPEFKEILQNRAIIAVNQDPLGIQGKRIYKERNVETWLRPISPMFEKCHSYAIAFVNRRDDGAPYFYNVTLKEIGLKHPAGYNFHDLYEVPHKESFKLTPDSVLKVRINPSGVRFFKATIIPGHMRK